MIITNKDNLQKINNWNDENIFIMTDFDRTITASDSEVSWGILPNSNIVPDEYTQDREIIHNFYRPIEIDETIDSETKNKYMIEWWTKHLKLLIKYKISKSMVDNVDLTAMHFRDGVKEFLEDMYKRNIPIVIMSAGIGNFIKQFLINNNADYDNIYIVSNFLSFENGVISGFSKDIIHSLNKNEKLIPDKIKNKLINRPNKFIFGDTTADSKMTNDNEHSLKIGFLEEKIDENLKAYESVFDVVCIGPTSFSDLGDKIEILRRKS